MLKTRKTRGILSLLALLLWPVPALAAPDVVATIRPLHSLAARVMEGVGEPELLLESAASPHSYAMRPSDALALNRADMVVWTGEAMETFLLRVIPGLPEKIIVLTATDARGLALLPVRAPHAREDAADLEAHDHKAGLPDAHIWLDPGNAVILLSAIADTLAGLDPENAAAYKANAARAAQDIAALEADIAAELSPVSDRPYVAAHDAYQYFERAFGLSYGGAVTAHPGRPPSARHMLKMTRHIRAEEIGCVLTEPGNRPPLIERLAREEGMTLVEADPLGLALTPGPALYEEMMRRLANAFVECLSPGE